MYMPNMIVFSFEREEILSFVAAWVDLKSAMLKETAKNRDIKVIFDMRNAK